MRLALFGTMIWGSACGTIFLLIKYVYAPRARLPGHLLLIGFTLLGDRRNAGTLASLSTSVARSKTRHFTSRASNLR
jgi:hypothetical protein